MYRWKDGRTEGQTTGISMSYPNFICGQQNLVLMTMILLYHAYGIKSFSKMIP